MQQIALIFLVLVLVGSSVTLLLVQVGRVETSKIIGGALALLLLAGAAAAGIAAKSPVDPGPRFQRR